MENMKKTVSQSMAVSEEEKRMVEILALHERLKAGTFTREIFYRGLFMYLKDRKVHAPKRDEEIYDEIMKLVESEEELKKIKDIVDFRMGLMDKGKDLGTKIGRKKGGKG